MGAVQTMCCCRYYLQHNREENKAILRMRTTRAPSRSAEPAPSDSRGSHMGNNVMFEPEHNRRPWDLQGSPKSNMGSRPTPNSHSSSTTGPESDRQLQAFISMRDQTDEDTEEWEKLNYDIHNLRYMRREVSARWKKILLQLGYQCEAESLLSVNKQSQTSRDKDNLQRASDLLQQLQDHTSLFLPGTRPQDRYLYIMDRLVSLDSAEDFITLAQEKYPKAKM